MYGFLPDRTVDESGIRGRSRKKTLNPGNPEASLGTFSRVS
jgi:hypothetical protein